MKLKQKIHQMVPQPIVRPWLALAIFLLCALLVFILSSFIQSELFIDLQNTPVLHILFSLCVPLTLFYDRGINLKFPFFIQKYLIDPQLAQDIAEQAVEHSQAIILAQRTIRPKCWQVKQSQLLLQLPNHDQSIWFTVDLKQVFNLSPCFTFPVKLSDAMVGQQIDIHFLMRTHVIIQLFEVSQNDDFSAMVGILDGPLREQWKLEKIPTALILDLSWITRIEALRISPESHELQLATGYGKIYLIHSHAKYFKKLELALSTRIDVVAYRKFKHDLKIDHLLISKKHPNFYRNLVLISIMVFIVVMALITSEWFLLLVNILILHLMYQFAQELKTDPFIKI